MTIMYCAAHPDEKYDSPDDWLRERYVQREEPGLHGVARGSDPGGYEPDITEKMRMPQKFQMNDLLCSRTL